MANALADMISASRNEDLSKIKRNIGLSGEEGDLLNQYAHQDVNSLRPITNATLNGQQLPQNYLRNNQTGQVTDLGASGKNIMLRGRPAILGEDGTIEIPHPNGNIFTSVQEENVRAEQQRRNAELADLPRRKALAEIAAKEAAANAMNAKATASTNPQGKPVNLSATAQKELFEAEDIATSSKNALSMLEEAKNLNSKAYSGVTAKPRAIIASNIPFIGATEGADATVNLDNLMTGQALESLKAVFGGMPTEGERKILLDMQASVDKTPAQRQLILDRAISLSKQRHAFNTEKAKKLRSGQYFQPEQAPQSSGVNIDDLINLYK